MPDLLVVSPEPQIRALAKIELPNVQVLAYLRAVGRARPETIAKRIGCTREFVLRHLFQLNQAEVVSEDARGFALSPIWRRILPEIVTIEAKVTHWQKAVVQAARNRLFAHRSFVALPESLALRVRHDPIFVRLGVGILSVDGTHQVKEIRRAHQYQPRVWTYYYKLASVVAMHLSGECHL